MLRPERATLSIVRGPDGDWQIGELECRGNSGIDFQTEKLYELCFNFDAFQLILSFRQAAFHELPDGCRAAPFAQQCFYFA